MENDDERISNIRVRNIKRACDKKSGCNNCKWFIKADCYWRKKIGKIPEEFTQDDESRVLKYFLIGLIEL